MKVISSSKKKLTTILILAAILLMPGFLYYLLQEKGKNRYHPLPIYGPKEVAATFRSVRGKKVADTIYHEVADFSFVNQNKDTINLENWKGKVVLVNLFYTSVNSDGAKIAMKAMQGFNALYGENKMMHLASISIDANDDAISLTTFAKSLDANAQKWDLLAGDTASVSKLVKQSLLLDALDNSTKTERKFIYSNKIVLLDTKHRIRGFYEATNQEALSKLDDEIKVLIAEELRNMRDGR